jgi:hypothetical protein
VSAFTERFIREARRRRIDNRLGAAFDRIADPADVCPPSPREVAELEVLMAKRAERDAKLLEKWCETYGISTEGSSSGFAALSEPRRSAD